MAHISEFFGHLATDKSEAAIRAAEDKHCPYLGETCVKRLSDGTISGACALKPATSGPVICCPIRLYADDYRIIRDVADRAFGPGMAFVPGPRARLESKKLGRPVVGVFGKRWGGELRLPQRQGVGGYFVDWVLALVGPDAGLVEFVAIEVQTIDTTGNYRASRLGLLEPSRRIVNSTAGLNWENVNKRIIPQLIYKGQVLQREEGCKKGLFFVCPTPVYQKVMTRLGGQAGLTTVHLQPAAITFLGYDYAVDAAAVQPGASVPLALEVEHTTTVYKLQERFSNIELPEANVYRNAIKIALGEV
ncbi:NotI family restriction endonuclease [Paenarthrobacter sp. TA1.8]|uniref:NotI family restriction endonuclease n=1 Tax=Paenarthrobacter sp. TA1.8 TaxID=3400219 RepID=UPI003B4318D9